MLSKKKKLLYFYTAESPFVEKDILIFSKQFEVIPFHFNLYQKKQMAFILIRQVFFLVRHILFSQVLVCQFAGLHAWLPILFSRMFFKHSIIVAGGTDCVSFPSIGYGNFSNPRNARLTRFCFRKCSLILPVHQSLVLYDYTYQDKDFPKQGIKYFIPELKTPIRVVYNGYDSHYWSRGGVEKQKASFFTVLGHVNSRFTLQLKGIDLFLETAKAFPEAHFTIVGGAGLQLENQPPNLKLISNIWGTDLVKVFAQQQFYVQLSMSEGFPNALSEAMLCECVPVVSKVGGMPDIVGECGYILKIKNKELLFELINTALKDEKLHQKGICSRERVSELYKFENRERGIEKAINELLEGKL
ncbi:MAG: glycosyltransferase [Bacteroidia bacterium]|nr:glycosyltransferase [Bacteroidia bacterium]